MSEPILTTKECAECGHVFLRYMDHMPNAKSDWKKDQKICPVCNKPVSLVQVQHLGEKL